MAQIRKFQRSIAAINTRGALLVYPVDNAKDPLSLWHVLHPRTRMTWDWTDESGSQVADLWHLRTELSRSSQVVYTKWYSGRATFFSRDAFVALLRRLHFDADAKLSRPARTLLDLLEDNSPLSTKQLKKFADLQGKNNEGVYMRALKELWERGLIVGFGEVDDGAFPSLAVAATRLLFEDLWREAQELASERAEARVQEIFLNSPRFSRFYRRLVAKAKTAAAPLRK